MPPEKSPPGLTVLVICSALLVMGFMSFNTIIGPIAREAGLAEWQVGLILTMAGLVWMACSTPWGTLSDRRGRKTVLVWSLLGFAVSFALLTLAVWGSVRHVWSAGIAFAVLLVARSLIAVFYAAIPATSQAMVADFTTPDKRNAGMAALGMASAVGMLVGPAVAALLSPVSLVAPVALGLLLAVAAWAVAKAKLPQGAPAAAEHATAIRWYDVRVRRACISAFITLAAVTTAEVNSGFLIQDLFKLQPQQAATSSGLVLLAVGFALFAAQGVVRALPAVTPLQWIQCGSLIAGITFAATPWATSLWMLGALYFAAGFGMGFLFPGLQTLASLQVAEHEQGAAGGALGAAQAVATVVVPIVSTMLYGMHPALPYAVTGGMLVLWCVWLVAVDAPPVPVAP
jgi:MFS transporter, DHA1 family, tetracycline resistance protein